MHLLRTHTGMSASVSVLVSLALAAVSCMASGSHEGDMGRAGADGTPPAAPAVAVHGIERGQAQGGDLGRITLFVSSFDDRTPPQDLGYRLLLTDGDLPRGLALPEGVVHSHRAREDGRRLDLITLDWIDGASDVQDAFDFGLVVFAVDRAGNTSAPSDTVRVYHSGSYIDIVYSFGVHAKNRLDTARRIFIKDMVVDPPITLKLTLTEKERRRVLAKAQEIGFFQLPEVITPDSTSCVATPCGHMYLKIRAGRVSHHVSWDTCRCWQMDSLRELAGMINAMITSKESYKRSPRPRGGYM